MRHYFYAGLLVPVLLFSATAATARDPITQWEERATKATAAGQRFTERFTASRPCEASQEEVQNRSRSSTRTSSSYDDVPSRQNRRRVNAPTDDLNQIVRIGPRLRFRSNSTSQRRQICQ